MKIVIIVPDSTELFTKQEIRSTIRYLESQREDIDTCIRELEDELR